MTLGNESRTGSPWGRLYHGVKKMWGEFYICVTVLIVVLFIIGLGFANGWIR